MVAVHAVELYEVLWRVVPLETPRVLRHCAKCGGIRRFASSDKFRLNAQQRKVDVWLIYKCLDCESTWNCTIMSRRTPNEIGAERYSRFQQNDRELAWEYAFDRGLLSRWGAQVDATVRVRVEQSSLDCSPEVHRQRRIRLELVHQCSLRLDRLLADELRVSRSRLQQWCQRGLLQIRPEEKDALRKPVRNGQIVSLYQEE